MPFLPDMVEKIKNAALASGLNPGKFFGAAADRAGNLARRSAETAEGWEEKLRALLPGAAREKFPWLKGKLVFLLAGSVLALAAVLVMLTAGLSRRAPPEGPAAPAGVFRPAPIPPDELFLPEEPDFLPPVILERERREAWAQEDAEPFWYRPLEDGGEFWREQAEKVIDDLLERVP
jgi:hypothetical protein